MCSLTALGRERERRVAVEQHYLALVGSFTGLPGPIKILLTLIIPGNNLASVGHWTGQEYFKVPLFKRS